MSPGKVILLVFVLVLAGAGVLYFGYVFFQVDEIEIAGNGKYTAVYIEGLAAIEPETHMLKLDERVIEENIESKEPYLEVVSVAKKLPKTVVIEVIERRAEALIAYADSLLLADKDANVLEIYPSLPEGNVYPVVTGFSISAATLGRQIETEDTFKITVYGELVTAINDKKMNELIAEIDLSDINSIKMTARNGLAVRFGQADHIADKISAIGTMLPRLERENRTTGELDVSSGPAGAIYVKGEEESQPQATPQATEDAAQNGGTGQQDGGGEEPDADAPTSGE
ncbi:MAG TPA: hypothetical protein DEB31_06955 [Clostridiales bacterium]|nr:hypothetical protein [Clostridiales bacterium]